MTPTPPPPDHNDASALEEIAHGIARLDPLLARYSARSTPLFLSRNLRDGWTEKVRIWDKDGTSTQERRTLMPDQLAAREERFKTFVAEALRRAATAMSDVAKAPLPRTFCLKLRGFDLGHLAKVGLPSSAQIAATLYIHNFPSDPISFYLGSFTIGIPQSTANLFTTPYRIPPSGNVDTFYGGPTGMASLFARTPGRDEEHNLSLRALTLPDGIAYIDLLLYDFADESMDLQGISLTWSAANATQVYARIEIAGPNAGPNGFSTTTQRVPLVWLRDEFPGRSRDKPGVRAEHQPQAFLNVELEWGVDSSAPFLRPRIPNPVPRGASTPPKNAKLVYRLSLQGGDHVLEVEKPTWACVLCSICASFPTQHILKVHLRRAHPQVETKFNKKRQDPVTGQDRFDVKVILPPEAIELSDDEEEEAPVTQTVAPSTRIGALLAASDENMIQQVSMEGLGFGVAGTIPSTPPRAILNPVKEEDEECNENWPTDGMVLLPINRGRSHSPTPALDSPVRQRRDHGPSSPTSPAQPNRPTPAPEPFVGIYSSRVRNKPRIYDVLRHLPMHYGVLNGQIIANEEEMFAQDYISDEPDDYETFAEEVLLMGALWSRWMTTEKYENRKWLHVGA
ncbi:hypothetical protein FRC10_005908 [Ceratobasidium sp. 414]|nr:hypothetical protein FRC10_005908 [Ceratobasidium sp. 414]